MDRENGARPPVFSLVGRPDSGKTTLIEKLVPELMSRGLRVGTIKHDAHSFEIDHVGKDSYRHKHAGAAVSLISSAKQVAMVRDVDHDHALADLVASYMPDVDVVITEGYRRDVCPKLEVFRGGHSTELLMTRADGLVAVVTDVPDLAAEVPLLDLNDVVALADFIEAGRPGA